MKRFLFAFVYGVLTFGAVSGANAYTVTYSCGTATGTAPTDSTNYDSDATVTVKPNTCTVPSGQHFAGYVCGSTNVAAGNKFTISGNTTCTAQWMNGKFSLTTTNTTTSLDFSLTAVGTFTVNCGDGGTLSDNAATTTVSGNTITRNDTTSVTYTCTWASAGAHTVSFDGTGTEYSTGTTTATISFYVNNTTTESAKLASIDGNLYNLFPPTGTSDGQIPRFYRTFRGATNLTSIPGTLFADYTAGVSNMFVRTFSGCTNLTGYIPPSLFAGLIANNAAYRTNMMKDIFTNSGLDESCPSGTTRYETIYDEYWSSKVSCIPTVTYNMTYSCGDGTGTAPTDSTNYTSGSSVTTPANTCTKANSTFTGWSCDGNTVAAGGTFTITANTTCTAQYAKFAVTTTNNTDSLQFSMSAAGTFTVDCGDGGTLTSSASPTDVSNGNTITRDGTTATIYTCTWDNAGAHIIGFDGTATDYNTTTSVAAISFYVGGSSAKIASISGKLSSMFPYINGNAVNGAQPRFYNTFRSATNLISIPKTLFADYTTASTHMFFYTFSECTGLTSILSELFENITSGADYMFFYTFSECTGLTSIPDNLFFPNAQSVSGASGMFSYTFSGCTGLTSIPSELFENITSGAGYMFSSTFSGCTGLTSIPSGLFFPNAQSVSGASSMFYGTFQGCTGLTSIPAGLFSKITSGAEGMFYSTFNRCSGLTSLPSGLFFPNAQSVSGSSNMFSSTFYGCTGLTSIPSELFENITSGANGMFSDTFNGCTGLTSIPNNLFFPNAQSVSGATYMFDGTFRGCTGLTSLPSELFENITSGANYMFQSTFYGCTGLTLLPSGLFSKITSGAKNMFRQTFYGCTNLGCATTGCSTGTGYIPSDLFAGITPRGENATNTMSNTFQNTKLVGTCPAGTTQVTTGWESYWGDNKVSCEPLYTCASGQYLPANQTTCASCQNGYTCSGGTYTFSKTSDQGIVVNTITILWNGASQSDIDANNAGTTTYGGDIRTPRAATPIPGKIFRGWKFTFDLTSLLNQTSTNASEYGFRNNPSASCGLRTNNMSNYYNQIKDQTWGATFSYGKVRGDALCSSTNNTNYTTGTPDESTGTGEYCWCRVVQYQPNGSDNWLKTSSSLWTTLVKYSDEEGCACNCAGNCGIKVYSDSNFRTAVYNISQ